MVKNSSTRDAVGLFLLRIRMPRIDDYENARRIVVEKLSKESFQETAERAGFETLCSKVLKIPFLDRLYRVDYPSFIFTDERENSRQVPIQEQVLILHYLSAENPAPITGTWVSYREISGASFYYSAFVKRAIDPLKKVFGCKIEAFSETARRLSGTVIHEGDTGFEFHVFPRVPIRLILWKGDDEFDPAAAIIFDRSIEYILSPEDIAWLSGMLVYRLISLYPFQCA